MRGAGIAPKDTFAAKTAGFLAIVLALVCLAVPSANATTAATLDIDFSQHGQGPFDRSFFSGATFTEGTFVGYIQGDEALVGPVAASIKKGFVSISARVAPANQGTADYTLAALSSAGRVIASNTVRVTQDTGDPETGPFGYVAVDLGPLPKKASSFRLSNTFVRSSHSQTTIVEFGVSSIAIPR